MGVSKRTQAIDEDILRRLAEGEPLAQIAKSHQIDVTTIANWQKADPEFRMLIQEARELGHDCIADDALQIVDGLKPVPNVPVEAARDRARAEIRLKLLAKWNPKKYGERVQLADADGEKLSNPLALEVMAMLRPMQPAIAAPLVQIEGSARVVEAQPVMDDISDMI